MLDHILAFLLLVVIPARALWRSRTRRLNQEPKTTRYLTTIGLVGGLLAFLVLDWHVARRPVEALGLGIPSATPALVGLAITVTLLTALAILVRRKAGEGSAIAERARRELLPATPNEVRLFLLLTMAVGFGWEVLYRGFLLFYLPAHVGLAAAVVASAVAYGAAHGFKSPGQFVGSIVAALAFAVGYALTDNLWWLIVLHTGLPLLTLSGRKGSGVGTEPGR